jgi:dipeptidyl aminopeptidase/acylaminoacyl peptidase
MRTIPILLMLFFTHNSDGRPSPADLLEPALYNNVLISPTGEYLAVVKSIGDETWFSIFDMADRKSTFNSNMGDKITIARVDWVSDNYLIVSPARKAFRDAMGLTGELFSIDARKGKIRRLSEKGCPNCGGAMVHPMINKPEEIIVSGSYDQFSEVHVVNIRRNTRRRLHRAPRPYSSFVPDVNGNIVFAIGTSPDNSTEIYQRDGSDWDLIDSYAYGEPGWLPTANGPTPDTFFTFDSRGGDTQGFGLYNTRTGEHKMLVKFENVDVSTFVRDFNFQVYAVQSDMHYPAIHYLSQKHPLARVRQFLQQSFPNQTISFTSVTRDSSQVVAYIYGDQHPGQYVLVDLKAQKVEKLFDSRPKLKPEQLAQMHPIEITARDGETVYAYLTEAPGVAKPGPMVVSLHGGPHGVRDYWGYNPESQMLASLGIHVLQINFRGSGGYGRSYENAGHGQWGALMQDDVTDATLWAIKNKIASEGRICIYGGSYGAYAALMGVAKEPDLYRCAVGYVGIYDLTMLETHGDIRGRKSGIAYLKKVVGTDESDLKRRSPVYLADQIKADVMLIQGGMDRRAPIAHSKRMRKVLEENGKEVVWRTETQQGHGFSGLTDQLELYHAISDFMAPRLGIDVSGMSWEKNEPER